MKKIVVSATALALVLTASPHAARAVPIDYIFDGIGSGTLGGSSFTNDAFNVTYVGGTLDVQNPSPNLFTNDSVGTFFATGPLAANFNSGTTTVLDTTRNSQINE